MKIALQVDRGQAPGAVAARAPGDQRPVKIPIESEFLVCKGTPKGHFSPPKYISCEKERSGTPFIQELCDVLESEAKKHHDLLELLTVVNKLVSQLDIEDKQIPEIQSTLTQLVYLTDK